MPITPEILFEDEAMLLVNKPAGLMVEPDRNQNPSLLNVMRTYLRQGQAGGKEPYLQHLHRLDRPVSGIVLFTKKKNVLKNLSEQFSERRVKKYYQAITNQSPENEKGTLEHWHRKEKKKAILYKEEIMYSEKAKLYYETSPHSSGNYLWDIDLHTGKYHQIRAQLSSLNCPILGDLMYGSLHPYRENAIALHACKLVFTHPITNQEMVIKSTPEFLAYP